MAYATPDGSPYQNYFLNNTPEAGWWNYLTSRGLVGTDNRSRFAQNRYGSQYGQYLGQAADNPDEGFYDYLQRKQPDFEQEFMAQAPGDRGDDSGRRLTPRARFLRAY